jgi:excisionase family DNA binding protein
MSSHIRVSRICQFCAEAFTAKTTVTKYCSHKCSRSAWKALHTKAKIAKSQGETREMSPSALDLIKSKEFLTVRDAALLLNCSRPTIYNMIATGKIHSVNLLSKKSIIHRNEIDKLFALPDIQPMVPDIQKELNVEACYHMAEIQEKFRISEKALYTLIRRNGIPRLKVGKYTFVPKSRIESLLNSNQK